ncbi:MAG: glycoside hydrolase family 2 TIM barrel-domain containing protein [Isosphaeraceae bacterium]
MAATLPSLLLTTLLSLGQTAEAAAWKPASGPLKTRWAADVRPEKVHPKYPRPQMVRPSWINLNGLWDYAIRPGAEEKPASYDGRILVPFPAESALSGVMKAVRPEQRLWYRRTVNIPSVPGLARWLLHFGAVDWEATVHVNGKAVGQHRGGFDPFTLDITDAIVPNQAQEIVVSVWDPTDAGGQPRGKQVLKPGGIMYTANTGIWQTVWLEPVPETRIDSLRIVPDVDRGEVRVTARLAGAKAAGDVSVSVLDGEQPAGTGSGPASSAIAIKLPNPKLWSPDTPFLYGLKVKAGNDEVASYFGMRKIALGRDQAGVNRLFLNGKPLFHLGPLDQGWWPDGLYTAPTDEALRFDIEITRKLGFNMIRKHVKVEPERWYYWCDTLGILVWQDMPSGDNKDDAAKKQFALELERMIDARENHPSIVMWVPFNEGWGQHDTPQYVDWIRRRDPTRLVNNASGWTDTGTGDVSDMHNYPGPGMPPLEDGRAAVLGEFGGLGLPLPGHLWVDRNNWGYRTFRNLGELQAGYGDLIRRLRALEAMGLGAAVYTQTTDCEVEVNGLLTYDRAVIKVPPELAASAHATLFGPLPSLKVVVPTAVAAPQSWSYTTTKPGEDWIRSEFDDAAWPKGKSGFGTKGTPGAIVNTEWKTGEIWLRRAFELDTSLAAPQLYIHHDEDAEVYLNGTLVSRLKGHTSGYGLVPLDRAGASAFRAGRNVLAVHCRQTSGGQYIDAGILELVEPKAAADRGTGREPFAIGPPPAALGLDPFYTKHLSVGGLPVVGSAKVSDHALKEAAYLVGKLLEHRPDVRDAMVRNKVRCAVMAYSERTTDIPEHRDLTPKNYWNVRARGLGATTARPAVSGAEENLLNYPGDPYSTENILIHEFGHAMHEMGLSTADPTFDKRLRDAFATASEAGLWKGTYAATNPHEYWAEGVQSWFDTNRENDSQHNHVNTRDELKKHDPALASLLREVFGDTTWRYVRPDRRADRAHLAGYDPARAPHFAWEPELLEANRKLRGDWAGKDEKPRAGAAGR